MNIDADGAMGWGPGSGATDVAFARNGVGTMRLDAQLTSYDSNTLNTYTPTIANDGTATYSRLEGYWQRIGKMIFVIIYAQANGAGSGATAITVTAPTNISVSMRQALHADASNISRAGVGNFDGVGSAISSAGGAANNVFEVVRVTKNGANAVTENIVGGDILATTIMTIEGFYWEE